ncbi:MAG: SRPBCC family protein [Alphaproteobacteria bacterium]|nr:SRPBCC family protein [Alphaproteobacteria bacterium]
MRWLAGIVSILAVIGGALVGVGWFILPVQLDVARTIEISRPRATVFTLVNNLKTFNEFSPWVEIDPMAEYTFSGPPAGKGQVSAWTSTSPVIGAGSLTIVRSVPNTRVDYLVERDGSRASSRFTIDGRGFRSTVTWSFSARCAPTLEALACRYMNAVARGQIERNYDLGLAKLKMLAERLPNADFENLAVQIVKTPPVDFAYHDAEAPLDPPQMLAAERASFAFVRDFLTKNAMRQAGPPIAETLAWDEGGRKYGFRAGYAYAGPPPAVAVGVRLGKSPAGTVAKTIHVGSYETLPETYLKLQAYVRAHRYVIAGAPWQVYLDADPGQEPAAPRTEISIPIAAE